MSDEMTCWGSKRHGDMENPDRFLSRWNDVGSTFYNYMFKFSNQYYCGVM